MCGGHVTLVSTQQTYEQVPLLGALSSVLIWWKWELVRWFF